MKHVFKYAGIMAIPVYIIFTYASHLYNYEINPIKYWLSDFGNPIVNPNGAIFYNIGCIITALLLAIFYIGMYQWYKRKYMAKRFIISYVVAQTSGLIGSIFLILTTVFTLGNYTEIHSILSAANMIAMDCFISFTAIGFLMNSKIPKYISIFGFITYIFNVITMNLFNNFYISEWIFFLLFMIYMTLITLQYNKFIKD
jgi:hypothetical protein